MADRLERKNNSDGVSLEAPPDIRTADYPTIGTLHLRRVLGVMQWCALALALFSGATYVFIKDFDVGFASIVIFIFFVVAVVAKRLLSHDNLLTVAVSIYAAILLSCLAVLVVLPALYSTLALTSLLAVALALPYTGQRVIRALMATSCTAAIAAVLVGPLLVAQASGQPVSLFSLIFGAVTLAAAVALAMLVLWQFRTRLVGALEQTRRAEEQARYEATHDSLTDLPNRALLEQRLYKWLSPPECNASNGASSHATHGTTRDLAPSFAVLFLDLDRFKYVNDSLGHHIGDELLQVVASRLLACIRPQEDDMVARLGGDEFILVLGKAHPRVSEAVAARIQEVLKRPVKLHGHELYVTASIGILTDCSGYETPEEILRDTDTAMFQAKEAGKARPAVFEPSMRAQATSHLRLETDLRRAVERGEFVVHYEPIVWLATGGVVGFEASLHWTHPERGLLPPEAFAPLAQESGLGYELDRFLLAETCHRVALWREGFPEHFPPMVSVDFSPDALLQENLANDIAYALKGTGLPAHALMVGFAEETIAERPETAVATLKRLQALGVQLSISGFGSWHSSLGFLHRLPVETIKIGPSFALGLRSIGEIKGIGIENKECREVARTILTVAHEFGMEVIAAGVETPAQRRVLSEIDCDYARGSYFSPPVDAQKAAIILAAEPAW